MLLTAATVDRRLRLLELLEYATDTMVFDRVAHDCAPLSWGGVTEHFLDGAVEHVTVT